MLSFRRSAERGHANHGWLDSRHTFSFADYDDPRWRGFRQLRVLNDDRIAPGAGFGAHSHRDMEIVTVVLEGAVEHRDDLGTRAVIRPGEVQRMTAGRGVTHSEFNASDVDPLHLLQIWILPAARGLNPGYEQKAFPESRRTGRLCRVASPDGRDGSVTLHQDVAIWSGLLGATGSVEHVLAKGRHAWVHVARGAATVNGHALDEGDAAAASDEERLILSGAPQAEILLFDLA